MADTPLPVSTVKDGHQRPSLGQIAGRLGGPVLLFSAVLAGTLGVSRFAVLPTLTAVEIDGNVRDAEHLQQYGVELRQKISSLEESRNTHVMPLQGTPYRMLTDRKALSVSVHSLLDRIRAIARSASPETPSAVHFNSIAMDADAHQVVLTGDVRGVGPGSMTVLAAFVDELRADPSVASITPPSFRRSDDVALGPHSPFRISLTMR